MQTSYPEICAVSKVASSLSLPLDDESQQSYINSAKYFRGTELWVVIVRRVALIWKRPCLQKRNFYTKASLKSARVTFKEFFNIALDIVMYVNLNKNTLK